MLTNEEWQQLHHLFRRLAVDENDKLILGQFMHELHTMAKAITDKPSAAQVLESTRVETHPLRRWESNEAINGPAEPYSKCAHTWALPLRDGMRNEGICTKCGAPQWFELTLAQDAAPTSSTLAKQGSPQSAAISEPAKSPFDLNEAHRRQL